MADLTITQLPNLLEADLRGPDLLPLADVSASETKHITTAALFKQGMQILPAGSISGDRLVSNSVTALELAPNSVTNSELADNAVDTAAIQDGAVTDAKIASGVNGSKITADTLPAAAIDPNAFNRGLDKSTGQIGIANNVGVGGVSGITWNQQGLITGGTKLQPNDLPIATAANVGGISVPINSGLYVTPAGAIDHVTLTPAGTMSGITYDEHGHIYNAAPLSANDLPIASNTLIGAVSVPVGGDLQIDGFGALTHADSPVAPGAYPKVTVNQTGHVTLGEALTQGDIPDLDVSIITTGAFTEQFIADKSITRRKLADYSISFIQETEPSSVNVHIGCLWYQESTSFLHCWNGNSWMGIGIGRLSQENLRFCGIINADTGLITGVTGFGVGAGYTIGDPLAAATDNQTGVYFVTERTPGGGEVSGTLNITSGTVSGAFTNVPTTGGSGVGFTVNAAGGALTVQQAGNGYKDGDVITVSGALIGSTTPGGDVEITLDATNTPNPPTSPPLGGGRNIKVKSVDGISFDTGDWVICNGSAAGWDRIDMAAVLGGGGGGGGPLHLNELLDVDSTVLVPERPNDADNRIIVLDPISSQWKGSTDIYGGEY